MCRVREPPHPLKHGWEGLLRAESWHPSSGARKAEETPQHPHNSPFPEKQASHLCQLCGEETSLSFVHLYEVPTHAPLRGLVFTAALCFGLCKYLRRLACSDAPRIPS